MPVSQWFNPTRYEFSGSTSTGGVWIDPQLVFFEDGKATRAGALKSSGTNVFKISRFQPVIRGDGIILGFDFRLFESVSELRELATVESVAFDSLGSFPTSVIESYDNLSLDPQFAERLISNVELGVLDFGITNVLNDSFGLSLVCTNLNNVSGVLYDIDVVQLRIEWFVTARSRLLYLSELTGAATARDHFLSILKGLGTCYGEVEAVLMADLDVEIETDLDVEIETDLKVELEKDFEVEVCS